MVYIDANELGWRPLLETWLSNKDFKWKDETRDYVWNMFNTYVDPCLKYVRKNLLEAMPQVSRDYSYNIYNCSFILQFFCLILIVFFY